MVLAVLPMVELVGVAEGVHDGLEDRFQNLRVAIYTKSIYKRFQEASSKITINCRPPPFFPKNRFAMSKTNKQTVIFGKLFSREMVENSVKPTYIYC